MLLAYVSSRLRRFLLRRVSEYSVAALLLAFPLSLQSQSLNSTPSNDGLSATSNQAAGARAFPVDEEFNPFDTSRFQAYLSRGLALQEAGEHEAALVVLRQAWQIKRIEQGLYHESQIPVLESLVVSELEAGNWEEAYRHYDYMAHLYQRLYAVDDPRLEAGLQKISSFYVNAFNVNLGGQREYHLRKAAKILSLRLEVAEQTLAEDHPRMDYLNESIAISRRNLYLMSDGHKEMQAKKQEATRGRLFATLE